MPTIELGVSPTLRQFWLKVKFWVHSQEWGCSAPALQTLVQQGLVSLTIEMSTGDGALLELWFRTMVHEAWLRYLPRQEGDEEALHALMTVFASDAEQCAGVLRSECDSSETAARVLRPVCEDAEAMATLVKACKPDQVLAWGGAVST